MASSHEYEEVYFSEDESGGQVYLNPPSRPRQQMRVEETDGKRKLKAFFGSLSMSFVGEFKPLPIIQ